MDRKREAFENLAVIKALNCSFVRDPVNRDGYFDGRVELAWKAYQLAYEDMYPVFDRIEEVVRSGGSLYRPSLRTDGWEIDNVNGDSLAIGKTFRELCVNLMVNGDETKTN